MQSIIVGHARIIGPARNNWLYIIKNKSGGLDVGQLKVLVIDFYIQLHVIHTVWAMYIYTVIHAPNWILKELNLSINTEPSDIHIWADKDSWADKNHFDISAKYLQLIWFILFNTYYHYARAENTRIPRNEYWFHA